MAFLSKISQTASRLMSVAGAYSEYKAGKNKETFQRLLFACMANGNGKQFDAASDLARMLYFEHRQNEMDFNFKDSTGKQTPMEKKMSDLNIRIETVNSALHRLEQACEPSVRTDF